MIERHDSAIVTAFARLTLPLAQLFALYVLAHGHYSPGGGFQAGVILAAAWILLALALGREALGRLDERGLLALGAGGILLYLGVGLAGMAAGSVFLDLGVLPLAATAARARYLGILAIEVAVTVTVAATLLVVFVRLADTHGG
jgi:multicomponent Na+:H+ antiporter subunit B